MKLASRIANAWSALRGAGPTQALSSANWGGGPMFGDGYNSRSSPSVDALINGFRGTSYACARLNANGVSRTPLRLYVTTAKGEARPRCDTRPTKVGTRARLERMAYAAPMLSRGLETGLEEIPDHVLINLFRTVNKSPDNPFAGLQSLLYYLQLCKEITGASYWRFDRDGLQTPSAIWPLDPRVRPVPLLHPAPDGRLIDYYLTQNGQKFTPDEIARFRFLAPRNPYVSAMGPMEASYQSQGVRDKFEGSVDALLSNVFHPSAIISSKNPDRPIGDVARARLDSDLKKHFTRGGQGRAVISDGALQYDAWLQQPTDTGGLEVSKDAKITICNCFDVPTTLLEAQDSNRASAEAGNYAHAVNAVSPRCETLAEELTAWTHRLDLDGSLNWHRLIWAFDSAVPEDEATQMTVNTGYIKAQVLVPDEVRATLGLAPRADGKGGEPVVVKQPKPDKAGKGKPDTPNGEAD